MPYLIIADREQELERLEIDGAITVGRAPDCDVALHDVLLSRHHCRLEPLGERWIITDLNSRNGSFVGPEKITRHVLRDGEVIRIGRTRLCFFEGAYVPVSVLPRWGRGTRPLDPREALAGTVIGLALNDMDDDSQASGFPIPQPIPAEPHGYKREQVHELVSSMSSGIWDTKLMTEPAARSRVLPRPQLDPYVLKVRTPRVSTAEVELPVRRPDRDSVPRPAPTRAQRLVVAASIVSAVLVFVSSTLVLLLA